MRPHTIEPSQQSSRRRARPILWEPAHDLAEGATSLCHAEHTRDFSYATQTVCLSDLVVTERLQKLDWQQQKWIWPWGSPNPKPLLIPDLHTYLVRGCDYTSITAKAKLVKTVITLIRVQIHLVEEHLPILYCIAGHWFQ